MLNFERGGGGWGGVRKRNGFVVISSFLAVRLQADVQLYS